MKDFRFRLLFFMTMFVFATIQNVIARDVQIVLDCSGSMWGALPDGQTRIEAAKNALESVVSSLPQDVSLAFRVFGAKSETKKRDCQDSQLLVPFGKAPENRDTIVSSARDITPRGYTPISFSLTRSAEDFFGRAPGERVIILISDGGENCQADPCALAKALKDNDASLVIHTVGFDIDAFGRSQLQCIARVTGGIYFSANTASELVTVLTRAVAQLPPTATTIVELPQKVLGRLVIEGPDLKGHKVTNAESGEIVGSISPVTSSLQLPAGIYSATFGKNVWSSIEVVSGETTILRPAHLGVTNSIVNGHKVIDPETGEVHASISSSTSKVAILPGRYHVLFGEAVWPVDLEEGETLILNPGVIQASGLDIRGYKILDLQGKKVGDISATRSYMPLPPGDYLLDIRSKKIPFTLKENETLQFK
ncbi:MAG: VWA domain-containing protein [Deltaproteobacteria bacterium]|nr:VWA domain-containing protein [Deltaproteobacteria bacterium]